MVMRKYSHIIVVYLTILAFLLFFSPIYAIAKGSASILAGQLQTIGIINPFHPCIAPNKNSLKKVIDIIQTKQDLLNSLVVIADYNCDQLEVNNIKDRISNIPTPILSALVDKNITIRIVCGPITDDEFFCYLKGTIPRGWEDTGMTWDDVPGAGGNPGIVRTGHSEFGKGHGSINLELHELGHAVDEWVFHSVSNNASFKTIWKKESKSLFGEEHYFNIYPEEYFAEVFAMYFLNNDEKKKIEEFAPLTFDFLKKIEAYKKS